MATKIDVGGYALFLQRAGSGSPTVVLEAGWASTAEVWAPVLALGYTLPLVCSYDRANLGRSDPAPKPRTCHDLVADLHILLHTAAVPGPYLLVGHSLGGLFICSYAQHYPQEVAGLVLIEAVHPAVYARWRAALPAATPSEPPGLQFWREALTTSMADPLADPDNLEGLDLETSTAQVSTGGDLGDLPVIVLRGGQDAWTADWPNSVHEQFNQIWRDGQQDLLQISARSCQWVSEQSGHMIPQTDPQIIVEAIRAVIKMA